MESVLDLGVVASIAPVFFGAERPKSWDSFGLVGHVRTLSESDLADNISQSEPKGTPFRTRTTYFSPDGGALFFEDSGSNCHRTDFVWQVGRLVEERDYQCEDQVFERAVKYVRDMKGRVVEEETDSGRDLKCTKHYRWDALQEEETEYCGDSLMSRKVRKHDEATGKDHVSWYTYSDDTGGEVLETRYEERELRLDDGTVRTEQLFGSGTVVVIAEPKGRILEEVRDSNAAYSRETHKFDESGREIEKAEWARDGTNINRRTYVYVNDAQGNWIRRTELFGSSAYSAPVQGEVTVRTIDYY